MSRRSAARRGETRPSADRPFTPQLVQSNPALSVPDLDEDVDTLAAALAYAKAGWFVGPVRKAEKHPGSVLGKGWPTRTSQDPATIASWFAGADDGVFLHCGRSGAVVLDVDDPNAIPEVLAKAFRETPPPYQSTRTDNPRRGHYLYALPPGRRIGNGTGKLGKAWGEVRGANGVIIVAPSEHEKAASGGCYRWQRTGTVPELPDSVAAALPDAEDTASAVTNAEVASFLDQHVAAGHSTLLVAILRRVDEELTRGSRHDTARDALCQAMREAQAGCYPARDAVAAIQGRFNAAVAGERRDFGEWAGLVAWAVAQAKLDDPAARRQRIEARVGPAEPPERPDDNPWTSSNADSPARPTGPVGCLPNLPDEFWARREFLGHIRAAAHARRVSADLVLHAVLARVSSVLDHRTRVDTGVDTGSLNYFVVPAGPSGAGKSRGMGAAHELMPLDYIPVAPGYRDEAPLGSGEGLAELYMGIVEQPTGEYYKSGPRQGEPKVKPVRTQARHNVLVSLDEGEGLMKTMERAGATIGPALRSAWTGATIGQANGRDDTTRIIPRGSYSLGVIIGFQPETIGTLLADTGGGTPQRFLYCSASDPTTPAERPPHPGPLKVESIAYIDRSGSFTVPVVDKDVLAQIDAESLARVQGNAPDPMDSQRPLHLAKTSALLAILDGRREITGDDWDLAEQVVTTSDSVLAALVERGRAEEQRRTQERDDHHVALAMRVEAGKQGMPQSLDRIARRLAELVHRDGVSVGRSALRRKLRSNDRDLYDDALELAAGQAWLVVDDTTVAPGTGRPA